MQRGRPERRRPGIGRDRWAWRGAVATLVCLGGYVALAGVTPQGGQCKPSVRQTPCATVYTSADCTVEIVPRPAGTVCTDGNACTSGDRCDGSGACVGTPVVCQPLDQCHLAGTCSPASGCANKMPAPGSACSGRKPCT